MWDRIKLTPTMTATAEIGYEEMQRLIYEVMEKVITDPLWKEGKECVIPFTNKDISYKLVLRHLGDRCEAVIGRESEFTNDNGNFSIEA